MSGTLRAFLSYTRLDDLAHHGGITKLRAALELQVRAVTADDSFEIFQDVDGIAFGEHWPNKLDQALAASRFFIPVLSPSFFRSEPCRDELRKFLAHEQAAGRDDLILPIYLVQAAVLEQPDLTEKDELATVIALRQRWDWRPYAFSPMTDEMVQRKVRALADAIGQRLNREVAAPSPSARVPTPTLGFPRVNSVTTPTVAQDLTTTSTLLPPSDLVDGNSHLGRVSAPPPDAKSKLVLALLAFSGTLLAGAIGVYVWTRLDSPPADSPEPNPIQSEAALRLPQSDWRAVQTALAMQGYDAGSPDGRPGDQTRQAIGDWQSGRGVPVTRYLAAGQRELIQAGEPKHGAVFRDCPDCPDLVVIPSGSFVMGSTPEERKWAVDQGGKEEDYKDEQQSDPVTIASFALGRTEVTRGQFARFVNDTKQDMSGGCNVWTGTDWKLDAGKSWQNPGYDQDDSHPVVCVSWNDAAAYAGWLKDQTGEEYRLPSEAEWEYAARARSTTMRFWGDDWRNDDACAFANAADLTAKDKFPAWIVFNCRDRNIFTARVASYMANGFGLFDVLGNVWEWTQDCYHGSYNGAAKDGSEWTSADCDPQRVLRGGAWHGPPRVLRSANRLRLAPDDRSGNVGFRVARMLTP